MAWLLLIGVDFLFHASLFAPLWEQDIPAFKPLDRLALLIPAGYLSFLLLTALIGYVFFKVFRTKPRKREVLQFGLIFGMLFSASNLLGLYSYVAIPLKQLVLFNLVYCIEIFIVTLSIHHMAFTTRLTTSIWVSILIFIFLLILGIAVQNVF